MKMSSICRLLCVLFTPWCLAAHTEEVVKFDTSYQQNNCSNCKVTTVSPCNNASNGSITIVPRSGTSPFLYSINGGKRYQRSNEFNNLSAGTYHVVVLDGKRCFTCRTTVTLFNRSTTLAFATTNVNPCGSSLGSITINATGGLAPYTYSIDGGVNFQSSNAFTNLVAATYQIVVKDASGCAVSGTDTLSQQNAFRVFAQLIQPSCNTMDGEIVVLQPSSGPYDYSIDGGLNFQSSNIFSSLGAGNYTLVVRNTTTLCQVTVIESLSTLTLNIARTNPTCPFDDNGSITINATGGTGGPYMYSIDNGMTYQSSNTFNGLVAGSYLIAVKDANNCLGFRAQTLTQNQTPLQVTYTASGFVCCPNAFDGQIVITSVTNGTPPYEYSIDGGVTYQSSNTFIFVSAYPSPKIVVKDVNECLSNPISLIICPEPALSFTTELQNPTAPDFDNGSITVNATGGTGPYMYSINGSSNYQSSNIFSGLTAGTYNLLVKDSVNCVLGPQTIILN